MKELYLLLSELFCNPEEVAVEDVKKKGYLLATYLYTLGNELSEKLLDFLTFYPPSAEEYIDLFELSPKCPLYLGAHLFEEPNTCAQAGVSDRNDYMIDLLGAYKYFGLKPDSKELPDFLPMVLEFLALTADRKEDQVRGRCIQEYILPALERMRERLQELGSYYILLFDVLAELLKLDIQKEEVKK
ncbi:nitrate reductase molybdenum cofactor assembly chaperone [Hydrogenobacter thermophilus]|uniref:nitrate reductase molybdenum cofactor assembly chaperone n=1 Tax=Hydrogenobacter thermophilus TaxID=940 RepID=UPI0030F7AF23